MRDKMAVEEGGKVTACGIYAAPLEYFQLRQRKDYPDTPPIFGPGLLQNEETSSVLSSPPTGARSV